MEFTDSVLNFIEQTIERAKRESKDEYERAQQEIELLKSFASMIKEKKLRVNLSADNPFNNLAAAAAAAQGLASLQLPDTTARRIISILEKSRTGLDAKAVTVELESMGTKQGGKTKLQNVVASKLVQLCSEQKIKRVGKGIYALNQ